jgi:hypothetical protein
MTTVVLDWDRGGNPGRLVKWIDRRSCDGKRGDESGQRPGIDLLARIPTCKLMF